MQRRDLTFRVFVSSTFSDLKAERDALQRDAFPRLRKYCEERSARFQAIDLRWGVSQEAALDQQTMDICFKELKRCQELSPKPNFIILLGQRYGGRPLPATIPADLLEKIKGWLTAEGVDNTEALGLLNYWYQLDANADPSEDVLRPRDPDGPFADHGEWGKIEQCMQKALCGARAIGLTEHELLPYCTSATHQEIDHGAFGATEAEKHVFAYLRDIKGDQAGAERISEFVDTDGSPDEKDLETLRRRIETELPQFNVLRYEADWRDVLRRNPPEPAKPPILDLENEPDLKALCDRVFEDLGVKDIPQDTNELVRKFRERMTGQSEGGENLLDAWLASVGRGLQDDQKALVLDRFVELPDHLLERAKLVDPKSKNPDACYPAEHDHSVKVWDAVPDLLTDWQFLEAKAEADPNFDYEVDRRQAAEAEVLQQDGQA